MGRYGLNRRGRRLARITPMKFRDVSPGRQFDTDRIGRSLAGIILAEAPSYFARFHPDGRIVTRIIADGPAKNIDADSAFFESIRGAV